jgi:hypothetical protein
MLEEGFLGGTLGISLGQNAQESAQASDTAHSQCFVASLNKVDAVLGGHLPQFTDAGCSV